MDMSRRRFLTFKSQAPPGRIPHWEAWSNPDAESFITGIDYYERPRSCRLKMNELYPELRLPVPATDQPKPRPVMGGSGPSSNPDAATVRWGDGESGTWEHGEKYFKSEEDVFAFNPLEHADMRDWPHVVENWDFSSEDIIYQNLRSRYPADWQEAPPGKEAAISFYNTTFMWPLLTFGWELFLACCLDERFEPVMAGFAEINRRVFKAISRLPIHFVICHDDIVMTRGPVCSPQWMHKYVFPRYEEYWSLLKAAGKTVIFLTDGCVDAFADDVVACGADGIFSEPYSDFKTIVRNHKDLFVAGEGDNRILSQGTPADIEKMVASMLETAQMTGGYMMAIGNHIPWNVPPQAVKLYLDLCNEKAWR